ncbi:hypothetical protein ACPUEN_14425 [Algoriphagus yeomjeoni]|uniref:hypothetical protein n=1 Tax=Algoriphagus yeomjeoni TaxID=291403 RepID=UPI003CE4661A
MKLIDFKKGRRLQIILSFIAFSIGCSSKRSSDIFEYSDLPLVDSIEIKLPLEFLPNSKWQTFNDSFQNLLIDYGLDRNGDLLVLRLDFEKGEYLDPIHIPREGPDGFNAPDVFISYQGLDSIYVFPATSDRFFLYNSLGKRTGEYRYNSSSSTHFYMSGFYSDIFFSDGKMILPTINDTRYDDKSYFEKVIPFQKYDLTKQRFSDSIEYIKSLAGKFLPSNLTGGQVSNYDDVNALLNYPFSDSLYLYNYERKSMQSFYCGIETGHRTKFYDHVPDRAESIDYIAKEKNYEFSKMHNGKIYRLVSHLKNENARELPVLDIITQDLRGVTMIKLDPKNSSINYYKMPIARNFVFIGNQLIVGGISSREDENQDTFRTFYVYQMD